MRRTTLPLLLLAAMLGVSGCATPIVEQERSGFISDYSSLVQTSKNTYEAVDPELASYTAFLIDTPALLVDHDDQATTGNLSATELSELIAYAEDRIKNRLEETGRYTVTSQPGQGVARIRLGITAVDPSVGALNLLLYTRITGAGLGGAAFEGEIVDSVGGQQLASTVQWGSGSRILRAGFTRLGDAKLQVNRWVKNLIQQLDQVHLDSKADA